MTKEMRKVVETDEGASQLLRSFRDLIQIARRRALRAVDAVQVETCWEIGRHIVEFEQKAQHGRNMGPGCCRPWLRLSPQSSGGVSTSRI
jgi:hypothetical protein